MFLVKEYRGADGQPLRYGQLTHPEQPATGKALLFIPGLGGSVKGALDFLELLLPVYSPIYAPDLRGFGLNPLTTPLYHARDLMADLAAFHEQVIQPAQRSEVATHLTLCGLSLGGILATLLAAQAPEYYRHLILLAPAFKPSPRSFTLSYTLRAILSFLILGKKARTQLPYGLSALTRNAAILNDPQYAQHEPLSLCPGFLLGVRDLSNKAMAAISQLKSPTMVVIPGEDVVCDPIAMREAYQRIPNTTPKICKEYPDFYHDILFEEGYDDIAQEILSWTGSKDSCSASASSR